jgi:hypothetical protein
MWSNKTVAGACFALVVIVGVDAIRSGDHPTTRTPETESPTADGPDYRRCARGDIVVAIDVRRPSSMQNAHIAEEAGNRPVATIVVRNIGARRCLGTWSTRFTITDRGGNIVGSWPDSAWFVDYYPPGRELTFSYPDIYRCRRAGPFAAFATVGPYSASRRNLSGSQIAGHVHTGCEP